MLQRSGGGGGVAAPGSASPLEPPLSLLAAVAVRRLKRLPSVDLRDVGKEDPGNERMS